MGQVTALSTMYPRMYPHLPGARDIDMLEALRETVRDFCKDTKAFSEELGPIAVVDWRRDYDLSDHHYYTAHIHQLKRVWLNGIEQGDDEFSLKRDRWLRWDDMHVPHDLDDALLTCGTAGITTLADWQAITDGSFGITIGSTSHEIEDVDFSGAETFDDVADIIQAGIRDAVDSQVGYVRAVCTTVAEDTLSHFLFWVKSDTTISALSAGSSGTDISGSGYINGVAGTVSPHIIAEVVLRPDFRVESMPYWFLDRYAEGIMAGAIARLSAQARKSWSDQGKAVLKAAEYAAAITEACSEEVFQGHDEPQYGLEG